MGLAHGLDHVRGQFADVCVDRFNRVLLSRAGPGRRNHGWAASFLAAGSVKAGRFVTPASFSASMTLMMIPNEAFSSAFKTNVLLRSAGRFSIAVLQFIDANRFAVELERILGIDTYDRVFEFRRLRGRGLGLRQIDLDFRLILFKGGRDDKKNEQDRQDVDERDNDNRRGAAFANGELHGGGFGRLVRSTAWERAPSRASGPRERRATDIPSESVRSSTC